MGEVYRARDTRMGRDVAIKASAARFSERFSREVHAVAALNHPNICTLHDVGPDYLVMELVEGPTLGERIREGAIPLEEALAIASQIADALDAAHEKGIIHRDLKPDNIKIKPGGVVKVLDFGLAKVNAAAGASTAAEDSPTFTAGETQAGVILGTAAYMAPEQARGKPVDKRADVWAFGVVLHEMVTGRRLFPGETTTEILASVLKEEPRWDRVPPQMQRLLRRCLEKDPERRLRHIGDAMEHRRVRRVAQVAAALQLARRAAGEDDRQRIEVVLVAVAQAAAVEHHRVIEQRAVAVGRRLQLLEEVAEHLHVIAVDHGELVHVLALVRVVRRVVEALAHAARRVDRVAVLAREHQRRDARDLRLVGEHLQVEHQLDVHPRSRPGRRRAHPADPDRVRAVASTCWTRRSISRTSSRYSPSRRRSPAGRSFSSDGT